MNIRETDVPREQYAHHALVAHPSHLPEVCVRRAAGSDAGVEMSHSSYSARVDAPLQPAAVSCALDLGLSLLLCHHTSCAREPHAPLARALVIVASAHHAQ